MEMETYQDFVGADPNEVPEASFATVAEVFQDGVTLIFDGLDGPTTKRYKTNAFVVFKPGDRVRVIKDSGTYVVEYPVGNPRTTFAADTASHAETADMADEAAHAETAEHATTAETANALSGGVSFASQAGSLRSGGNGQQVFLIYQNGGFYVATQGGAARRIDNV